MTTQVKPTSSGSWTNVTLKTNKATDKTTTWGITLSAGATAAACRAVNQWTNCAGLGNASTLARKIAAAVGLSLQEV
jgi:hypothetical protein